MAKQGSTKAETKSVIAAVATGSDVASNAANPFKLLEKEGSDTTQPADQRQLNQQAKDTPSTALKMTPAEQQLMITYAQLWGSATRVGEQGSPGVLAFHATCSHQQIQKVACLVEQVMNQGQGNIHADVYDTITRFIVGVVGQLGTASTTTAFEQPTHPDYAGPVQQVSNKKTTVQQITFAQAAQQALQKQDDEIKANSHKMLISGNLGGFLRAAQQETAGQEASTSNAEGEAGAVKPTPPSTDAAKQAMQAFVSALCPNGQEIINSMESVEVVSETQWVAAFKSEELKKRCMPRIRTAMRKWSTRAAGVAPAPKDAEAHKRWQAKQVYCDDKLTACQLAIRRQLQSTKNHLSRMYGPQHVRWQGEAIYVNPFGLHGWVPYEGTYYDWNGKPVPAPPAPKKRA